MFRRHLLLACLIATGLSTPATAGIFSRKPRPNPAVRVPELLLQIRNSQDESVRSTAAEELRQYDPNAHPELMTALIDALSKDPSAGVRSEAAASLGRLRPISQQAGYALEQAQNGDSSMRVRLAARQALFQYHLVGYRSGKPDVPGEKDQTRQVSVSPVGKDSPTGLVKAPPAVRTVMTPRGAIRETAEPPLADATLSPHAQPVAIPTSQPKGPAPTQLIPTQPQRFRLLPRIERPTAAIAKPASDGPALPPP